MNITLIGYGKMGRAVEGEATERGHQVVHRVTRENNTGKFSGDWVGKTDVLVDFSVGSAVASHVAEAVEAGLPIVVGTTGWRENLDEVKRIVEDGNGACLYSSNFSLGVQALFYLSRVAGQLMSRLKGFAPYIVETHHDQKRDAPSGTALTMKNILQESFEFQIPVSSVRAGFFPGTHELGFDSPVDTLRLVHTARNRQGFARGVLFACEWIQGKTGFHELEEVLFSE